MGTKQGELEDLRKGLERSISFNYWEFTQPKLEASDHSKGRIMSLQIKKPTILLLQSATLFTPRPVSELDAAATKVQKVYKSYRTRRDLADCAALVEELWWQTLDFAALKRGSVSFYNIEKHESADRSGHGLGQGLPIGKGLCKDKKAQKLALQHWLVAENPTFDLNLILTHFCDNTQANREGFASLFSQIDPRHRLDVGDGKYTNLNKCPRSPGLQRGSFNEKSADVRSLLNDRLSITLTDSMPIENKEREAYEVIVENGKLAHRQSGMLVYTVEESTWFFVLSTSRSLYVGQKKKELFSTQALFQKGPRLNMIIFITILSRNHVAYE